MSGIPVLDLSLLEWQLPSSRRAFATTCDARPTRSASSRCRARCPAELIERAYATARAFFALPESHKLAIENVKSPHFRG